MSSVLRKKIGAGGGLPPTIRQCEPLWLALASSIGQWTQEVYGQVSTPDLISRKVFSGADLPSAAHDVFTYVSPEHNVGPVAAVTINFAGAQRYSAQRLRQGASSLNNAPELFLRLMAESAARALWKRMACSISSDSDANAPAQLIDIARAAEPFDADTTYINLTYKLGDGDGEDSWLIEGETAAPEIGVIVRLSAIKSLAKAFQENAARPKSQDDTGRGVLRERVRHTSVVLDAVLDSMRMTIGECAEMKIGQVISLPGAKMDKLDLSAGTVSGSLPISQGELGAWKGQRALKLKAPVPEDVIREIAEI